MAPASSPSAPPTAVPQSLALGKRVRLRHDSVHWFICARWVAGNDGRGSRNQAHPGRDDSDAAVGVQDNEVGDAARKTPGDDQSKSRSAKWKRANCHTPLILNAIKKSIAEIKNSVISTLENINKEGNYKIIGYGAPAKMITFVFQLELTKFNFLCVIDDNIEKQHLFAPTWGIEIVSRENARLLVKEDLAVDPRANYIIYVFPWNLSSEIINKIDGIAPPYSYCLWMNNGLQLKELS